MKYIKLLGIQSEIFENKKDKVMRDITIELRQKRID